MQRDMMKARMGKLPQLPALDPSGVELSEEEAAELSDSFITAPAVHPSIKPRPNRSGRDYSPASAAGSFADALTVNVKLDSASTQPDNFRVYYTAPVATNGDDDSSGGGRGTVFVCVHGAGYSGLSWAAFAKELTSQSKGKAGVLAYDARSHGKTTVDEAREGPAELSLERLSKDLVALLKTMFPVKEEAPSFVLVGHSMGGSVVVDACPQVQEQVGDVAGLTVVDVVEGSALEALVGMNALVAGRPKGFDTIEQAIEWHVRTKTVANLASARISVPPLFTDTTNATPPREHNFMWRTDLAATEPYWRGWFTGLSSKFLACKTAKLLLLAGADRLDREMMVAQMQGKYQLEIFPEFGHCVQEDAPERTAAALLLFWERNERTTSLFVNGKVVKVGGRD